MLRLKVVVAAMLGSLAGVGYVSAGTKGWVRLETPPFEVWTDAGTAAARDALRSLLQIRQILAKVAPGQQETAHPLRVFLFQSEQDFAPFRPAEEPRAAGFFHFDATCDYIVAKYAGTRTGAVLFHEYMHRHLRQNDVRVPRWFNEGISELFSSAQVKGAEIQVGTPIPAHLRTLQAQTTLDLKILFTPAARGQENQELFYAASWALVRLLTLDPGYSSGLRPFLFRITTGVAHEQAFQQSFGKSLDEVARDLWRSLSGNRLPPWNLRSEPIATEVTGEPLEQSPAEYGFALAKLHLALGHADEAGRRLDGIAASQPTDPEIYARLGDLFMRRGEPGKAFEDYSQAIRLGTRDGGVYFKRAMLQRDQAASAVQVIADLRKAVELNPSDPEAESQLQALSSRTVAAPEVRRSTPSGWENRKGNRNIEGTLKYLDCSGKTARFILSTGGGQVALAAVDPAKVVLLNHAGPSATFACGALEPVAVRVEYVEEPDAALGTAGEITSIDFKPAP